MSYTINLTNGNILATIADGTINSTATSLTLIGKNYAGYGTFLNDNLVHILENSSSSSAPTTPLTGQLWWDSANNLMKVYNGSQWKTISAATSSPTQPTGNVAGDITGNVTGSNIIGNGAYLYSLTGANVTGTVANANYSNFAGSSLTADSAYIANLVYDNNQPNINQLGTLIYLDVNGPITTDTITANDATVNDLLTVGSVAGDGSGLYNINGSNVLGKVANAVFSDAAAQANLANYVTHVIASSQPNITSLGTLTGLNVAGWANVSLGVNAANVYAGAVGNASTVLTGSLINVASAYIPQLNVTAANIAGTTTFGGQLYCLSRKEKLSVPKRLSLRRIAPDSPQKMRRTSCACGGNGV